MRTAVDPAVDGALPGPPVTVVEWFTRVAAAGPARVAVADDTEALTYAALDARANRLAHHLRARGVGPDVLVGLCLERSVGMVVAMLGVLKAGGAYVPLDPTYPRERLRFMVEDGGVDLVVTAAGAAAAAVPPAARTVVCLDRDRAALAAARADAPQGTPAPDTLAYVIYTSGSTGTPKGVQIPHRALVNFLASMQREPGLAAADVLLAVTTLSFDIAALEIFLPLVVGARVAVASRATAADGRALARRLAETGATVMQATPVTWRMLVEADWTDRRLTMLCGGEALPRDLAERLLARGGALWNLYGPTETTIWSTVHRVRPGAGPVPIGHPIANTTLHVHDPAGRPVPPGTEGELYIGGAGLARGYRNRPDLTAERFVPAPAGPPGTRLYRTGDLVRARPDGTLECLGRLDHQVKLHGFRIELGEIESVLRRHPAVRDVVVVARPAPGGDLRLVAYLQCAPGPVPTVGALRAFALQWLPPYMAPAACVVLDAFPHTPNGKLDRNALPAPEAARPRLQTSFARPAGGSQEMVAETWSSVLGVPDPGIDDNFFDLGGTSLLLLAVRDALAKSTERDLDLADLFRCPTIRALAGLLEGTAPERKARAAGHRERARRRRLALAGEGEPDDQEDKAPA